MRCCCFAAACAALPLLLALTSLADLLQPFLTDVSGKDTFETVPTQVRKNLWREPIANFPPTLDAGPRRSLRRGPAARRY